ncbi:MAG: DUF4184 family protein [Demequinaceae bacterium]|nr:DUF4184 family protein [Demequinaceae bacterium]
MPLTPYHMGPGILLKALFRGSFSLMVFGYANVLIDLQPLIAITSGRGETHGWTHTWLAAIVIGAFAAVTGKWLADLALRLVASRDRSDLRVRWWVAALSAYLGTSSHIALDSLTHGNMHPFEPFSDAQPWLGAVTPGNLRLLCVIAGAVGTVLYFAGLWFRRRAVLRPTQRP